jgi:hypothetical protein
MDDRTSVKNYPTTLLLAIFLGFLGAHRLYTGKVFTGVLFFVSFGLLGIGWLIDIITVAVGNFTDKTGRFIRPRPSPPTPEGHTMAHTPDNPSPTPNEGTPSSVTPPDTPTNPATSTGGSGDTPKKKVPTWLWVVGGILVLGLVINAFGGSDSGETAADPPASAPAAPNEPEGTDDQVAQEPAEEVAAEPEAGFGDGTYIVGENLDPGIYRSTGTNLCYWERMSGFGGTFEEIIANGNEGTIVEIVASDAGFKTERCGQWLPLEDTYPDSPATQFGDGTYEVGTHIEPGRYSNSGGDNCYYERKSGFSQTFSDIIANDFGSTTAVVEIRESDRGFSTRGCGTWTKSG